MSTVAGPAVGAIVLYMLDSGLHHGEDRPGIVIRVYQEEVEPVAVAAAEAAQEEASDTRFDNVPASPIPAGETLVDLMVFTLGLEDFNPGVPGHLGFLPRFGIRHDPSGKMPNYWH